MNFSWSESLDEKSEEINFARIRFRRLFGQRAEQWHIQVSGWRYGEPRLAVAVDAELVASIRAAVRNAGGRLGTIRPLFVTVMNRWRSVFPRHRDASVAILDQQSVVLGMVAGRGASVLYKGPIPEDGIDVLLERECLRAGKGLPDARYALLLGADGNAIGRFQGMRLPIPPTPGFDPVGDAALSAALLSV